MVEGKEPLRTFGDLMQFFENRHRADDGPDGDGGEPPTT